MHHLVLEVQAACGVPRCTIPQGFLSLRVTQQKDMEGGKSMPGCVMRSHRFGPLTYHRPVPPNISIKWDFSEGPLIFILRSEKGTTNDPHGFLEMPVPTGSLDENLPKVFSIGPMTLTVQWSEVVQSLEEATLGHHALVESAAQKSADVPQATQTSEEATLMYVPVEPQRNAQDFVHVLVAEAMQSSEEETLPPRATSSAYPQFPQTSGPPTVLAPPGYTAPLVYPHEKVAASHKAGGDSHAGGMPSVALSPLTSTQVFDICSMPETSILDNMMRGAELLDWDYDADPRKHLTYLKIFFDRSTMDYLPGTLWASADWPDDIWAMIEELHREFATINAKPHVLEGLSPESTFDFLVMRAWTSKAHSCIIAHGPLLGNGKMKGHELYEEKGQGDPFIMARVPGKESEYPFYEHGRDLCIGMKCALMECGLWQSSQVVVPNAKLPVQSSESTNRAVLFKEYYPQGVDPSSTSSDPMDDKDGFDCAGCGSRFNMASSILADRDYVTNEVRYNGVSFCSNCAEDERVMPQPDDTWVSYTHCDRCGRTTDGFDREAQEYTVRGGLQTWWVCQQCAVQPERPEYDTCPACYACGWRLPCRAVRCCYAGYACSAMRKLPVQSTE